MSFDLRSLPDDRSRPRLFLIQLPLRPKRSALTAVDVPTTLASLEGAGLDFAKAALTLIDGIKNADAFLGQDSNVRLEEDTGLRVALMCISLSTSRASEKLSTAAKRIMALEASEAQYWFAKLQAGQALPKDKVERLRRLFFDVLDVDIEG